MTKTEDLDPELAGLVRAEGGKLGLPYIDHPLIDAAPYIPQLHAFYNLQLRQKKASVKKAMGRKDWLNVIVLHTRPYRPAAFGAIQDRLTDRQYWKLLGEVWIDSESPAALLDFLHSTRPHRDRMMTGPERRLLASLPPVLTVYRGHQGANRNDLSYTLSPGRAGWFANRFRPGQVRRGRVRKADVLALFTGRNEAEILSFDVAPVLPLRRPPALTALRAKAEAVFTRGWRSDHGPLHWEQVERNALDLCKQVKGADPWVCRLFATVHDCKRENETDDPDHGPRAAALLRKRRADWLPELSNDQLAKLVYAVRHHTDGLTSTDPTIGVCWDADRLDLPRVLIAPSGKLLSTQAAKYLLHGE
jgi:uncharacterized protein